MGLSANEVLAELGITKVTLYKWVLQGKIKRIKHKVGASVYYDYARDEVLRVKARMKKERDPGKALLKDR